MKNLKLNFFTTNKEVQIPIEDYFLRFPIEQFDLLKIQVDVDAQEIIIKAVNEYFKSNKPKLTFPTGVKAVPTELWFDNDRKNQLRNGFIPIMIFFINPYIPNAKGSFSWEV